MTKRKTKVEAYTVDEENLADIERSATIFTHLLYAVNPAISRQATYEILIGGFIAGLDEVSAKKLGGQIRRTSRFGASDAKH